MSTKDKENQPSHSSSKWRRVKNAFRKKSKKEGTIVVPETEGSIDALADAFIRYNDKKPVEEQRGMCVIVTLYTGDSVKHSCLKEQYQRDKQRAESFFKACNYDVFCGDDFTYCSQAKLESSINIIQQEIQNKAREQDKAYDIFVLIVLTHGDEEGLLTCKEGSKGSEIEYEDPENEETRHTKVDYICDQFKHDQVPALKDKPKIFLIQACRGSKVLVRKGPSASASGLYDIPNLDNKVQQTPTAPNHPVPDSSKLRFQSTIPIDGDQLVYYSTIPDYPSWTERGKGSLFIQNTLDVFSRHSKSRHVEEMLTVANFAISEVRHKGSLPDGTIDVVAQMPCKDSTLRKTVYL